MIPSGAYALLGQRLEALTRSWRPCRSWRWTPGCTGETCPADGVLVTCHELLTEESALTGEAFPVAKTAAPLLTEEVAETAWCHAGTRIVRGDGLLNITLLKRFGSSLNLHLHPSTVLRTCFHMFAYEGVYVPG